MYSKRGLPLPTVRSILGFRATISLLVFLLSALHPNAASARPEANILQLSDITESYGVIREQRLVDGVIPAPESPIDDFVASLFLGPNSQVLFDLGETRTVTAIQLVAMDDAMVIEISADGETFERVTLTEAGAAEPMKLYLADGLELATRYLRIEVSEWRSRGAVAELLVFERTPGTAPVELPVEMPVQTPPTYQEAAQEIIEAERRISRIMLALALVALGLLLWAQASGGRRQTVLCLVLVAVAAAGWLRLGTLRVDGTWIHAWDLMHYQLGAKYFHELGYRELYRCAAEWERQAGRAVMVDHAKIRNLDDNHLHPGSWAETDDGQCRADFDDARWQAFGGDLDDVRRLFKFRRLHQALRDHGYNATPPQTLLLESLVGPFSARHGTLFALSLLDVLAIAGAIGCLWWAFGPVAGAGAALLIGFGDPWGFSWVGGSIGRYFWLLALCAGLALLARQRWITGSALVTAAGLLRLFPVMLLAGPALWALRAWRRGEPEDRRVAKRLALGATATALVGLLAPALAYGPDVYSAFLDNSRIHASVPPSNHMGFGVLASAQLESSALAAEAPGWRRIVWMLALGGAFLWLAWALRRPHEPWQALAMSAPLLFASIPLSSYDYVWMVILVPLAASSRLLLATLLGYVALTNFLPELVPEGKDFYLIASVGVLLVLIAFALKARSRTNASTT
ncbi:MAG: hypothetical protein AAF560_10215 [Acidobacteriota bacterium]